MRKGPSPRYFTADGWLWEHPKFRDNRKIVAGVLSRHAPRPSSLHPSPRGEPLQLRALRGASRATPLSIIGSHGIYDA